MGVSVKSLVALALAAFCGLSSDAADGPSVGDKAPGFELPGTDGKTHALASLVGKRAVVIAWFPKAFTGG